MAIRFQLLPVLEPGQTPRSHKFARRCLHASPKGDHTFCRRCHEMWVAVGFPELLQGPTVNTRYRYECKTCNRRFSSKKEMRKPAAGSKEPDLYLGCFAATPSNMLQGRTPTSEVSAIQVEAASSPVPLMMTDHTGTGISANVTSTNVDPAMDSSSSEVEAAEEATFAPSRSSRLGNARGRTTPNRSLHLVPLGLHSFPPTLHRPRLPHHRRCFRSDVQQQV